MTFSNFSGIPEELYFSIIRPPICSCFMVNSSMSEKTAEGFVVYAGSHIAAVDDDTIPDTIKERRAKTAVDKEGKLTEELLFTSPSYAAMFVTGKSENGLTRWRDKDGRTLKSLESEE